MNFLDMITNIAVHYVNKKLNYREKQRISYHFLGWDR